MKNILVAVLIMATTLVFAVGAWAAVTTTGNVEPANPAIWTSATDSYVGRSADGTMEVDGGTVILSDRSDIGRDTGVTGSVTVTGTGSTWTNDFLLVGNYGTGSLNITDGGLVTSNSGAGVGIQTIGVGTVTVDGAGSQWVTDTSGSSWLYVGDYGNGTLTISNGGVVNSAISILGAYTASGAATVTGSGSQWINTSELVVGYTGIGTLTIADGGSVSNTVGTIGYSNGIGTVTVTGTGSTWTNSGELIVGESGGSGTLIISNGGEVIASQAVIDSTSTLSGDGILTLNSGSGILTNHGTIAPGNSIGTLTVDGDVVFENGSTFEVEIDNAGNSDKLDVSGDVTINSGSTLTINSNGETITDNKQYTLIEANGGITGTFDTVDTALVSWDTGVTGSMLYPGSTAVLVIGTPSVTPFDAPSLLLTDNQRACGRVVEQISDDGGTLGGITAALQGIVGDDNLRFAYDQLSGQTRPSIAPIADAGVSSFASTVLGRMHNPQTGALGTNSQYYPDSKHYFWINGFGLNGERDSKEGVNGSDYDTGGVATGLDHQVTENFRIGITLGWSDTDVEYDNTRDNSSIESFYSGLYTNYKYLNGYIDGIFIYADLDSETNRYVDFVGEKNEGGFDGYEILASVETARNYYFKDILVQPLLGFELSYQRQDSYTETGGSSALHYDKQSFESYKSLLGIKASKYFYNNDQQSLWGQLQAKWAHEFGDASTDIGVSFASESSYRFSIKDAKINRDSAILNAGLKYAPYKNTVLFVDYDAHVNNDIVAHILSGGIRLAF